MQSLHPSRIGLFVEVNVVVAFSENFGLKAILVKKVYEAGAVKDTVYYVDENFVRVANSSGTYDFTYVKHEGQLVAQLNPDGSKYYIHGDSEGSTSVVTDSNGRMLENTTYTPYGEILSGGSLSRFDSEGKEYSSVVGDYDFSFRKYKPEWGLFTQPDTLIQNVYDPQSLNRYAFERNNPYNRVDPTGHIALAIGLIIAGMGLFTAIHEAATQYSITGEIYSERRIGKAFVSGVASGTVDAVGIAAAFYGGPIGGLVGLSITVLGITSTVESVKEAEQAAKDYVTNKEKEEKRKTEKDKQKPESKPLIKI